MSLNTIVEKLEANEGSPCLSIVIPTHRTFPDNKNDQIVLKNVCKNVEDALLNSHDKREVAAVLDRLGEVEQDVDHNFNLDSLHVFISDQIKKVVRLPLSVNKEEFEISDNFNVDHLKDFIQNSKEYAILCLSQGGVNLYHAMNESILEEVRNDDFPFPENPHYITHSDKSSDAKAVDNMVKEYFNKIDKAVVRYYNETKIKVFVICTKSNYGLLQSVADRREIYLGQGDINYNDVRPITLVEKAWEVLNK